MGEENRGGRTGLLVWVYPFALLLISALLNVLVFGVNPMAIVLPSTESVATLSLAGALLVINHSWLMTTTELTRVRFDMHATPAEWEASGRNPEDVPKAGHRELERRHNMHRNTTENSVYFVFLALLFALVAPPGPAMLCWGLGYPIARLGYTFTFLAGSTNLRGLFMSMSLLAMYGITSYLIISLFLPTA